MRFSARVTQDSSSRAAIVIPFDPDQAWGAKANHPVSGTIRPATEAAGNRRLRGRVTPDGSRDSDFRPPERQRQHTTIMSTSSEPYQLNHGTGPGVITPDGCAVEFYALVPPRQEPGIVHAAAPSPQASVLELGAGTGRIADALADLGHPVVAVDESPEMLARVRRAEPACATIQGLALDRRFDLVLLASHLINSPEESVRRAFMETCARHVADDGCVIIQQHPPDWFSTVAEAQNESGGITVRLRDLSRPGPGLVSATVEYQAGDRLWTHSFTAARLDEPALHALLADAGLSFDRYLTDDHQWLRAVPARSQR